MSCTFSSDLIEQVSKFHGHSCPGLAIGIRVAELARRELPNAGPGELVAVVETDMCGVDAIQVITGCTFGKGNLIHRDYGKMAFSFFDRQAVKGFRAVFKSGVRSGIVDELQALMKKSAVGSTTVDQQQRSRELREKLIERLLELELDSMFTIQPLAELPPRPAKVLDSLACEGCGEKTMESRTRRFGGQTLCIPCFQKVEQKI